MCRVHFTSPFYTKLLQLWWNLPKVHALVGAYSWLALLSGRAGNGVAWGRPPCQC